MNKDLKNILRDLRRKNTDRSNLGIQLKIDDDGLMKMKGQDGYTPVKGVDYWTPEEVEEMVTAIFNAAKPNKGKDYFTKEEKKELIEEVLKMATPIKGVHYHDGKDGEDGEDGVDGENPDPRQVAVDAITLLESFEGDARLSAKALKDLDEAVTEILKKGADFELSEKQITTIKDLLPKYPPINAGGSGATFLKSLRDVDLSGLTKNADGKYVLGGSGASTFLNLTDTPSSYSGQAGKFTRVNAGEDGLEFATITGGGDFLADGSVPMTGDLDMNGNDINNVNSIQLDPTPTAVADTPGLVRYNQDEDTIDIVTNHNIYQVGQELSPLYKNQTGSTIGDAVPVMAAGAVGASGRILIQKAIADGSIEPHRFVGLTTESIANGDDGKVTWYGKVRNIDTTGTPYGETWAEGDELYVSPTTAGYITNVKPNATDYQIFIGYVVNVHAVNGTIKVFPSWNPKLEDLADVNGTPLTTTGQFPVWDNTAGYFDFTENIFDRFDKTVDDTDDITEGATNKFATAAEKTKLGHITVTQAVDLDAIETRVNQLDAAVVLKGSWDASAGTFPGSGTAQAGDSYIVSVGGTVDSVVFNVGDRIVAITDNASTSTYASNWLKLDYTDQVSSVAGKTGAVTLVTADITDITASAAELNTLDGITATVTELNYTDGVTSNIQTQLDAKLASSAYDDATAAETNTGTSTTKYVSPDGLAGSNFGVTKVNILVSDPGGSAITTGNGKAYHRIPAELNGMNLVGVSASLSTVSSSGAVTVMVRRSRRSSATARTDADMLSTAITIDQSEFDSVDAATAAVINTSNDDVATGDHIYIDIDGAGTGAKGLLVELRYQLP